MERLKKLWHIAVKLPLVKRAFALALGLILGLGLEQVARLNVLPPETVELLRHALSALR